jgi:hypothetical protein
MSAKRVQGTHAFHKTGSSLGRLLPFTFGLRPTCPTTMPYQYVKNRDIQHQNFLNVLDNTAFFLGEVDVLLGTVFIALRRHKAGSVCVTFHQDSYSVQSPARE